LVTGRIGPGRALGYWIGQFTGAVAAAGCLPAFFPAFDLAATGAGTPVPATGVTAPAAILLEALMTFLLMFVIYGTAVDPERPQGLGGFAIGLTLGLCVLMGGPVTGASLNPARTFGPALVSNTWSGHLVYWVGPLVGAVGAALLYDGLLIGKKEPSAA
jgi:glycerol uptake facilitator-like aquaporin